MTELHKLPSENLLVKAGDCSLKCLFICFSWSFVKTSVCLPLCLAVVAVSNLACGLYNRRLYDRAFTLVEMLCKDLCKNRPVLLSVDRVCSFIIIRPTGFEGQLHQDFFFFFLHFTLLTILSFECLVEPPLHAGRADISALRTTGAGAGLGDPVAEGSRGRSPQSPG